MGLDIEKTAGIIDTLRNMTNRELAVTVFLIVSCVAGAFWVEQRYANLKATAAQLERQQQAIRQHELKVKSIQQNVMNLVNSLPVEVRNEILARSKLNEVLDPDPRNFVESTSP